ncbi:hypothetical protein ABFA07_001211 [Porites harrisoni]
MKSVEYICLNVAFFVMVLMDLAGNTLVILVIRLNKSMRTPMNMLLLNLAVADMVVAVFVAIQFVIGPTFEHPSGTTGLWLCKFITGGTMTWSAAAVSVGNLVAISIERYHAVVQPLASRSTLTKTKLKLIIFGCWLFGFVWNVPLFAVMTYRADLEICGEQWPGHIFPIVYSFGWSVVAGIVPISLMSYLYSRVVYKLWFEVTPAVPSTSAKKASLSKKKATIAVITVSLIYAICWVPVLVMYCLAQSLPNMMVLSHQHKVTILLAMFNSSINPVVYSFTSARFRKHLVKLLRCKCYSNNSEKQLKPLAQRSQPTASDGM